MASAKIKTKKIEETLFNCYVGVLEIIENKKPLYTVSAKIKRMSFVDAMKDAEILAGEMQVQILQP